jgi:flagellar biosynthesis protein FlhF
LSPAETGAPAPRKFLAPTSREALRLARQSLGGGALVLASRAVPEGFEVVAMAEEAAATLVESAPHAPAAAAAGADHVLSELHSMRSMIEERLASVMWSDQQRRDPVRGRLLRTMLGAGFSARLAKAMLERLPAGRSYAQGEAFVRSELLRAVPVQQDDEAMLAEGGVYALVGPTGVGKTTTTAKLAARCVLRFGADKLALVTTDGYRIGAYEQLRIYGQILGVPVHAVKDAANLQLLLAELRDKHMVLIDTVGMSQRDRAVSDQVAMLCGAGRPVKRLLLLNGSSHGDTLNEVVYAYQHAAAGNQLAGCIFTKLDEAVSHGALLDTVIRHRLPVHYVCNGQQVPENLMVADAGQLVELALQAPAPGALFALDPDLLAQAAPAPAEPPAAANPAAEDSDRLRLQYRRFIQAMAHDAEEVAAAARTLAGTNLGFAPARELWAIAARDEVSDDVVRELLLNEAVMRSATWCETHVLAVCGRARLDGGEHGDSFDLQGAFLLADRDGQPFAAPNQWLAAADARSGARQLDWLHRQEFGRALVHMLPRLPGRSELTRLGACNARWVARAAGATACVAPESGEATSLSQLVLDFGAEEAMNFRDRPALRALAHSTVLVRLPGGEPVAVRCVARRTTDAKSGRLLGQCFVLSNLGPEVDPRDIAQWQEWASRAEPCFRLAAKGVALLGGLGAAGAAASARRLLVAGQVATTAWRLLHAQGEALERTRVLLCELAGRQVRSARGHSAGVLYEGLAKLFPLLDALGAESIEAPPPGAAP